MHSDHSDNDYDGDGDGGDDGDDDDDDEEEEEENEENEGNDDDDEEEEDDDEEEEEDYDEEEEGEEDSAFERVMVATIRLVIYVKESCNPVRRSGKYPFAALLSRICADMRTARALYFSLAQVLTQEIATKKNRFEIQ